MGSVAAWQRGSVAVALARLKQRQRRESNRARESGSDPGTFSHSFWSDRRWLLLAAWRGSARPCGSDALADGDHHQGAGEGAQGGRIVISWDVAWLPPEVPASFLATAAQGRHWLVGTAGTRFVSGAATTSTVVLHRERPLSSIE
jgi:hypothetical protein